MQQTAPNVEALFFAALELESSEARSRFLDRHCRDRELRRRVEQLLAVDAEASGFLEAPASMPTVTAARDSRPDVEESGTTIGPYKLLEAIGEGGMGTVYLAEQAEPVRRRVALKVIKPGMDSKQVVARFEAERQALALMDHPNIARVLDAGATDGGRPYFVMEAVRGIPITEYCDRAKLSIARRLDLFIPVCQAVQHAHQKGIIHRDLKPSNVLVGLYDGRPVPKVIDFGVAKATGPSLTGATLFTGFGTVVGTPEYMSPEQAQLDNLDIDTRSDIYSLGVLLYELLTGTTPLDRRRLGQAALLEVLRVVREEEPPRPSTRLGTTEEVPAIAANRNVGPHRLSGLVRGELDWIVMKALEKDRNRRYESANGLAADLRRYLDDEPVQACPPSTAYRLRKLLHRHRGGVVTAASLAGLLVLGTAVSAWQAVRATRAEGLARTQEGKALVALDKAKDKRDLALKAVEDMWVGFAEKWLADEPALEQTQREFVEKALAFYERLTREEGDDPELQREIGLAHHRLGAIHDRLGDLDRSTAAYAQAADVFGRLARRDPGSAEYRYWQARSMAEHGEVCDRLGRGPEAEDLGRRALGLFEKAAADFPGDLRIRAGLADCCLVLGSVNFLPGPRLNLIYITDAASERRWTECLRLLPRALSLYPKVVTGEPGKSDHRWRFHRAQKILAQMPNVPWAERQRLSRESIAGFEGLIREFPREHRPRTELCEALGFRGSLLRGCGQPTEAEEAFRQALAMADKLVADYPNVPYYVEMQASARHRLGSHLAYADRPAEAEPLLGRAADALGAVPQGIVPPAEPWNQAASCYRDLGYIRAHAGRLGEAEEALRKALALDLRVAREHQNSATWAFLIEDSNRLEWAGLRAGHVEDAVRPYREVAAAWEQLADAHPTDPMVGQLAALAFNGTALYLERRGRFEEADRSFVQAQAILERNPPVDVGFGMISRSWNGWPFVQANRANLRWVAGHPEEAAEAYRRRVDWFRRRAEAARSGAAADRIKVAEALRELACYLDRLGRPVEPIVQAYREAIAVSEQLADDVPAEPKYRGEGAKARMELASVMQRAGRADEANALADEAVDIRRSIARSGKPIDRGALAETLSDHALVRWRTGRSEEAVADLDEAAALLGPFAGEGAGIAEAITALARVQDRRGRLLERESRLPEAEAAYAQAVALRERLARSTSEDLPDRLDRRSAHAGSLATLGRFLRRHGQAEPAVRRLAEARTAYEQMAADFPHVGDAHYYLALFLATCPEKTLRDPSGAIRCAERDIALSSGLGGMGIGVLGVAQCQVGDDRAAVANLELAPRLRRQDHPEQLFFRARARWRLGEEDAARRDYDEAVRLTAFYDDDWSELGQFREEAAAVLGIEKKGSPDPLSRGE